MAYIGPFSFKHHKTAGVTYQRYCCCMWMQADLLLLLAPCSAMLLLTPLLPPLQPLDITATTPQTLLLQVEAPALLLLLTLLILTAPAPVLLLIRCLWLRGDPPL